MIDSILWKLVKLLDLKCIVIYENEKPYLARFYLHNNNSEISIFLHYFFESDDPDSFHNHPWAKSFSLILFGGYVEEWFLNTESVINIKSTTYSPKDLNTIYPAKFHRISLTQPGCWSLFIGADKLCGWHFWNKNTGEYDHWIDRNNKVKSEPLECTTAKDKRLEKYRKNAKDNWKKEV